MSQRPDLPATREDKIKKADYLFGYAQGLHRASEARASLVGEATFLLLRALVDDLEVKEIPVELAAIATPEPSPAPEPAPKKRTTRKKTEAAPAADQTQENPA